MRRIGMVGAVVGVFFLALPAMAQDAVKADPAHYKVELENNHVRVLRVHYGAHEKSVMHSHPATLAVFLTDGHAVFHMPDGKTVDAPIKAGTTQWSNAETHMPENVGDTPFDVIVVEMKQHQAPAKAKAKTK